MAEGHNSANERLKSFVERLERLDEEKKAIATDFNEVMSEAKSVGFDTKIIRKVLRARKLDAEKRREEEDLFETYMAALGILD